MTNEETEDPVRKVAKEVGDEIRKWEDNAIREMEYTGPYFLPPWQIGPEFGEVSEKSAGWFAFQDMLRIEKPEIWKLLW